MRKQTIWEQVKEYIGSLGWRVFVWSLDMTVQEYRNIIYEDELHFRQQGEDNEG